MESRGVRNNNPGNIDFNPNIKWIGQVGKEPLGRFCVFDTAEHGIRACAKIILSYYHKHRLRSLRAMLQRYAPPVENNTAAYVNTLAKALGVSPDTDLVLTEDVLVQIVTAIIKHENGYQPYPEAIIRAGVHAAW